VTAKASIPNSSNQNVHINGKQNRWPNPVSLLPRLETKKIMRWWDRS